MKIFILVIAPLFVIVFSFLNLFVLSVQVLKLSFSQFIIITLCTTVSLGILYKGKINNLTTLSIFAFVLYSIVHFSLFWMLAKPDKLVDARIFFVDIIVENGKIEPLNAFAEQEGSFYTKYPSIWLLASFIQLTSSLNSFTSLSLSHLAGYLSFTLYMYTFVRKVTNGSKNMKISDITPVFIIIITPYAVQNSQFLVSANSLGILGLAALIIVLYSLLLQGKLDNIEKKRIVSGALISIPLLIVSPVPLLSGSLIFSLLILNLLILGAWKKATELLGIFAVVLLVIWPYISNIVLQLILSGGFYHYIVLAEYFLEEVNVFQLRTSSSEVLKEQSLHFIYPYSNIIVPIYYIAPLVIGFISSTILLIKAINNLKSTSCQRNIGVNVIAFYLTTLQVQTIYTGIIFIFGYGGIENALARYAYLYLVPLNLMITLKSVYAYLTRDLDSNTNHKLYLFSRVILTLIFLLLFLVVNLEAFYSPWFSLKEIPDLFQIKILFGYTNDENTKITT